MPPYLRSFRFSLLKFSQVPIRVFSTRVQDLNKHVCATDNQVEIVRELNEQLLQRAEGPNYTCTCPCQDALANIMRQLSPNVPSSDEKKAIERLNPVKETVWENGDDRTSMERENNEETEILKKLEQDGYKKNFILQLHPYRYTADDILFGRNNSLVESQSWHLGARFADCFFISLPPHLRTPAGPDAKRDPQTQICDTSVLQTSVEEVGKTTPKSSAPEDLAWTPAQDICEENVSRFSDFVQFMEFFMAGLFTKEDCIRVNQFSPYSVSHGELGPTLQPHEVRKAGSVVNVPGLLFYSNGEKTADKKGPSDRRGKPSLEQLTQMQDYLAENLPKLFVKRMEYQIYRQDVVFENNYATKPYTTIGINAYVWQVVRMRFYAHFKFANVRIHLLKVTVHEDDGSIKVRWRLSGIPQTRAFMFWKFLPWTYRGKVDEESEWHDGISTFYLDGTGVVYKHKMDRLMPDEEVAAKASATPLNTGLAT